MNAREMFEELGYELEKDTNHTIEFYSINNMYEKEERWITFYLNDKDYVISSMTNEEFNGSVMIPQEHQAITQQMKELGWIE